MLTPAAHQTEWQRRARVLSVVTSTAAHAQVDGLFLQATLGVDIGLASGRAYSASFYTVQGDPVPPHFGYAFLFSFSILPVVNMHLRQYACVPVVWVAYPTGQWPGPGVEALEFSLADGNFVDISLKGKHRMAHHAKRQECT